MGTEKPGTMDSLEIFYKIAQDNTVLVHFAKRIRINNSNIPGNDPSQVWDVSGFIDKVEFE
jgi:hypothetical protein